MVEREFANTLSIKNRKARVSPYVYGHLVKIVSFLIFPESVCN